MVNVCNMTDTQPVDIRVRNVPEELRQRFKAASNREGHTYEEMIRAVVDYYENDPQGFRQGVERARRGRHRRRSRE